MARPQKVGLDYFELDCHMDEKIELIEAEFGLKGFAVIVKLYQSITRTAEKLIICIIMYQVISRFFTV